MTLTIVFIVVVVILVAVLVGILYVLFSIGRDAGKYL